jgi:phage terminase large subunit-like protein
MIGSKLGAVIAMVVGGLLTNFASAGSDSDKDLTDEEKRQIFVGNLPDGMVEYLTKSCNERQATSEDPITDMINEGILDAEKYAGITCLHITMERGLDSMEKSLANDCAELKATRTPEQLESLRELGLKCLQ